MERGSLTALQGVFRLSGDSLEIGATRDRLDLGAAVDLARVGPHSVSGLVKLFLRSLPEPLLRFDHYDQLVAAFRADQMAQIDADIGRLPGACDIAWRDPLEWGRKNCWALVKRQRLQSICSAGGAACICHSGLPVRMA